MATHEFSEDHNKKFEQFGYVIIAFVALLVVGGIIRIIDTIIDFADIGTGIGIVLIIASILELGVAFLLFRPYDNIKNIYETEGSDIEELETAFSEFNQTFLVVIVLTFFLVVGHIASLISGV